MSSHDLVCMAHPLAKRARKMGDAGGAALDEMVHERCAALASSVNNDGVHAQVMFLLEHGEKPEDIDDALDSAQEGADA